MSQYRERRPAVLFLAHRRVRANRARQRDQIGRENTRMGRTGRRAQPGAVASAGRRGARQARRRRTADKSLCSPTVATSANWPRVDHFRSTPSLRARGPDCYQPAPRKDPDVASARARGTGEGNRGSGRCGNAAIKVISWTALRHARTVTVTEVARRVGMDCAGLSACSSLDHRDRPPESRNTHDRPCGVRRGDDE